MARRPAQKTTGFQFQITSAPVVAKPRALKAKWSIQSVKAFKRDFGISLPSAVDNVAIEVGLPPQIYAWLQLHSMAFHEFTKARLARRRVGGRHFYVLPINLGELWKIGEWKLSAFDVRDEGKAARGTPAVDAWFDAIDKKIEPIMDMDDVVTLTPICAKLVVAREPKNCAWRKRKT